jgi:methionine-gamma-lyase
MSHGYKPELSQGAIKSPIFQTSTFVFPTAEAGKAFFEVAYGLREQGCGEELGLIYSRINNPDLEILEDRLCLWDEAEDCAVFESGMAAITTVLMEFLEPGDLLLHSCPVYGGTEHFIEKILTKYGITSVTFYPTDSKEDILAKLEATGKAERLSMVFLETPCNPTNALIDMTMCREIADAFSTPDHPVIMAVDNTYLGPLWQHPLKFGADLVLYSATKYIGGHSDLIAGACLGSCALMKRVKALRTFLGNMAAPWTGWLLLRSLETLKVRMECAAANAGRVAAYLRKHPKVEKVYYLGLIPPADASYAVYRRQSCSPGAMISFDVRGGQAEAFSFLNALRLIRLAVSLGGTESLAEHPATMTHADVPPEEKAIMSVSDKLVRLSVGIENADDIIHDIDQALSHV